MDKNTLNHTRLHNLHVMAKPFEHAEEVVNWLGAVQSQDYYGAKWGLGMRMQNASDSAVEQAFLDGLILRTHVLRPTWHFVTPADIRWMLALTAPRVHKVNATMYRRLELDADTVKKSYKVLERSLRNHNYQTRNELRQRMEEAGIIVGEPLRMAHIIMHAELEAIVCSGPRRGKQFTYALVEERAPNARKLSPDEALAELAHRFFTSRGPATEHDFSKWSGLTVADARRGVNEVAKDMQMEEIDGQMHWFPPADIEKPVEPKAYLISVFDEYISSYRDWGGIIDEQYRKQLIDQGKDLVILLDGRIIGTWKRTFRKEQVEIQLDIVSPVTATGRQAIEAAAQEYGDFLGLEIVII